MMRTTLLRISLLVVIIGVLAIAKPDGSATATVAPYMGMDTLHMFAGNGSEGTWPEASMITINDSILYGTTVEGGSTGYWGTLYKVVNSGTWWSPSSTFSVVHHFHDGSINNDGANCVRKLAKDNSGYIYGTCWAGGSGDGGVVYRLNTSNDAISILYHFDCYNYDGCNPEGLVRDNSGNLYGVTITGTYMEPVESGIIWKLSPSGGGYSYSILHIFDIYSDGGAGPNSITLGSDGNLYGTTAAGGAYYSGIIWRYDLGNDTFSTISDAPTCRSGLTSVPSAYTSGGRVELWGTTCDGGTYNYGTVFRLVETSPGSGSFNYYNMHSFNNGTNEGYNPRGDLVFSPNFAAFGALYGTLMTGGVSGSGSFFRIDLSGNYSEIPSNAGQWNSGPYPNSEPYAIVEGKIGSSSPVFFGNSIDGGYGSSPGNGWLWYIYLF